MGSFASKPPAPTFQLSTSTPTAPKSGGVMQIVIAMAAIALFFVVLFSLGSVAGDIGITTSPDQVPTEIDGKVGTTVASAISGSNTNLQFWMYIKDWNYKFNETKHVIAQTSSTNPGVHAPKVTLHPTDNSLDVTVSVYPGESDLGTSNNGSGSTYTVTLENVPLQSWFAVSISIHGRSIDVYLNGMLVVSGILPGVPMPASGNLIIGGGGGFSGSICTVRAGSVQLTPADAAGFYSAGTGCSSSTAGNSASSDLNNLSLFGYTFVFGVKDSAGKQVTGLSSSDVSGWFSSSK
jgi:hypothetical protein